MKNKNKIFRLLILVLCFTMLTACLGKKEKQQTGPDKFVTLSFYKPFVSAETMQPVFNAFKKKYPKISIKFKEFNNYEDYWKLVLNEMAEGEGPDIISLPNSMVIPNYRKLIPVPPTAYSPEMYSNDFLEIAVKSSVFVDPLDGVAKVYGIPLAVDNLAIYYNKKHFEENIPEQGKPSLTWDGIQEDCVKLNKTSKNSLSKFSNSCIALGRGDNISKSVDIFTNLFLAYGGKFYDNKFSTVLMNECDLKNPTGIRCPASEAFSFISTFAKSNHKNYSWNKYTALANSNEKEMMSFVKGKVSMIFGFSNLYPYLEDLIAHEDKKGSTISLSDIKTAPFPQLKVDENSKKTSYASFFVESISRNTKNPDEAMLFLSFLASKQAAEAYTNSAKAPPARRDLITDKLTAPIIGTFVEQAGYSDMIFIFDFELYYKLINNIVDFSLTSSRLTDTLESSSVKFSKVIPDYFKNPPKQSKKSKKK